MGPDLSPLKAIVGEGAYVEDPALLDRYLIEWRGLYHGRSPLVLKPASTAEVSAIMACCTAQGIAVVPQGGNSGLVGGAIPWSSDSQLQVVLSAERLNRIREIDAANGTMTAEAGCILAGLQQAAAEAGLLFPLSLAAEGSCQLGGNISTNAGGINVLRYGNTRDLILGLEVVLPDGRVLPMLRGLRKDNTGYDLKQLFIGAEGTLGFITAASCRLYPQPTSLATAFVAVDSVDAAVALYSAARRDLGGELQACELLGELALDFALAYQPALRHPLPAAGSWFVLLEAASSRLGADMDEELGRFLSQAMEQGLLADAVLATSGAQRSQFWELRHCISAAQKQAGASIKHDISLPLSKLAEFVAKVSDWLVSQVPGCRPVTFGHLGDGNLHFNVSQPADADPEDFLGRWEFLSRYVHGQAVGLGGSFSAEHGIGTLKAAELAHWRDPVELALMQAIKRTVDPAGIMNPGKLFSAPVLK